jgi:hypothetical protein
VRLVDREIARFDWKSLQCGCGEPATHVADMLRSLADAVDERIIDLDLVDGHIVAPSIVEAPALPAVSVCLAAIADELAPPARLKFLELLLYLVGDNGQPLALAQEGRDLASECRQAAMPGLWLLYSEVLRSGSPAAAGYAYEILSILDEESDDRLSTLRRQASTRLPADIADK